MIEAVELSVNRLGRLPPRRKFFSLQIRSFVFNPRADRRPNWLLKHNLDHLRPAKPALGNIVVALVDRTLIWISRNRRLCRDYERHTGKAAGFVRLAMIRIMLRRLAIKPST
jgi:hypothetical protein